MLAKAGVMLTAELTDEAGRAAYLAAFHAAQAFIFERTGRTTRTHQGVRSQFGQATRDDARIDVTLRRFLTDGYDMKSLADYAIGPDAVVPRAEAVQAIETATRFVACIAVVLGG
jgi:uncharacterized protein (UPF0332 family)